MDSQRGECFLERHWQLAYCQPRSATLFKPFKHASLLLDHPLALQTIAIGEIQITRRADH